VIVDERNTVDLKKNSKIVLLTSSLEKIIQRISVDSTRPPLKEGLSFKEEHHQIFNERLSKYNAAADCIFETTYLKPREIALKIIGHFKKKGWI